MPWSRAAPPSRSARADFVLAAEACGASKARIIAGEILPNVLNQVIVVATLEMAIAILVEAALSFLGLGTQPPTPSWGLMVAEGRNFMFFKPYLIELPGRGDLPARHRDQHDGRRRARRHRARGRN